MRTLERCDHIYNELNNGSLVRYQSEASARYILYGTKETSMPNFAPNLDASLNSQAYLFVSIGLDYYGHGNIERSEECFERAGTIWEYINRDKAHQDNFSEYGLLMSALAYYCAGQISKSYVVAQDESKDISIGALIRYWIHKDFRKLQEQIAEILLTDNPDIPSEVKTFAKSLSKIIAFIQHGDYALLDSAVLDMAQLKNDAINNGEPDLWIVSMLMSHIFERLRKTSLWTHIPKLGTDENIIKTYIHNLFYSKHIFELFKTQIEALDVILKGDGAVISLPTSSGKTRIAELAILNTLMTDPEAAVLYLAPFKSLAYEVESNFESVFAPLHITVTHLYGDNDYTDIDKSKMEEASVWIATPEKAKVIYRYGGFNKRIALVVMDEGHLIDDSSRNVTNEMFTEELRTKVESDNGRYIVLSAVLPNAKDIAEWLTKGDNELVSSWQLSTQRPGVIMNYPAKVELEWDPEKNCFNPNFIGGSYDVYASCAEVAVRFQEFGPVLVFVGKTEEVYGQASEIYRLITDEADVNWKDDTSDWDKFVLICNEDDTTGEILKYAKKGILCHCATLPDSIRYSMEHLLRKGTAKYIVATSTLAQGVNLGVTSVIFSSIDQGYHDNIKKREFWNIAGRAGRAFDDTEGRVLFYVDAKGWDRGLARKDYAWSTYLADKGLENVKSGVLSIIQKILSICSSSQFSVEQIIEMIENDDLKLPAKENEKISTWLDWIDDSMLSIIIDKQSSIDEIGKYIDSTLALRQARDEEKSIVKRVIAARYKRNMKYIESDQTYFTCTGLTLSASTTIFAQIDKATEIIRSYCNSSQTPDDLLKAIEQLEDIILSIPSKSYCKVSKRHLNLYRLNWFNGLPIPQKRVAVWMKQFYKNAMPWVLNALAGYFATNQQNAESANALSRISTCSGLGILSYWACRIYLSGIQSRKASLELAAKLPDYSNDSIQYIKELILSKDVNLESLSELAKEWIEILRKDKMILEQRIHKIPAFSIECHEVASQMLYLCNKSGNYYLRDVDYSNVIPFKSDDYDLSLIADVPGLFFIKTDVYNYELVSENERYQIVI